MKFIDINGTERECTSISVDKNYPGFMKVEFVSKFRKGYAHSEWYPVPDFIKNNPTLKDLTKSAEVAQKDELGVVSSAKPRQLSDKIKNWTINIYAGYPIWIARGKGEGQTRYVLSNTKNSVIIDKDWETIPDYTSQYIISFNVNDPQVMGNSLSVVPNGTQETVKEPKPKTKKTRAN
jgi:hypothetical protein